MGKMKTCTKCSIQKPETFEYFYRSRGKPDSQCKKCVDKRNREYMAKNRQNLLAKRRAYYGGISANPRGIWAMLGERLRGKPRGVRRCTSNEFVEWYNSQKQECVYCKIIPKDLHLDTMNTKKKYVINRLSIDRKDPKGNYEPNNMVLACMRCNWIKSDFFTYEEMLKIGAEYIAPKRKHIG